MSDFKVGDRVQFQLEGDKSGNILFGVVIRVLAGPMIKPDVQLPLGARLTNIKKVQP